jgi:hypothetical protein
MMRSKVVALALAAALAIGSTTVASGGGGPPPVVHHHHSSTPWVPWVIIGCSAFLVWTAMVANARDNRPLINNEHWWCGLPYWFKLPPQ